MWPVKAGPTRIIRNQRIGPADFHARPRAMHGWILHTTLVAQLIAVGLQKSCDKVAKKTGGCHQSKRLVV
jgi:hypothetical protein